MAKPDLDSIFAACDSRPRVGDSLHGEFVSTLTHAYHCRYTLLNELDGIVFFLLERVENGN